jgi:hypothetical protein
MRVKAENRMVTEAFSAMYLRKRVMYSDFAFISLFFTTHKDKYRN